MKQLSFWLLFKVKLVRLLKKKVIRRPKKPGELPGKLLQEKYRIRFAGGLARICKIYSFILRILPTFRRSCSSCLFSVKKACQEVLRGIAIPKRPTKSKLDFLEESGLVGCLTGSGVTSKNYKDILHEN